MLRLCHNIFKLSQKLKGPTAERLKKGKSDSQLTQVEIIEDFFKDYYSETNHLQIYKNSFTGKELGSSNTMVKRVFSLENATPTEVLKFRIGEAVKKHQKNLMDHGSAAVQCAAMSQRIIFTMIHSKKYPRDDKTARALVKLIEKRRTMLHYLARTDYHRYKWVCTDYGIPDQPPKDGHHKTNFMSYKNRHTSY